MSLTQVSGNIFLVSLIMGDLGLPTVLQEQQSAFLTQTDGALGHFQYSETILLMFTSQTSHKSLTVTKTVNSYIHESTLE